jgi:hypothetical protein
MTLSILDYLPLVPLLLVIAAATWVLLTDRRK